MGVGRTMAMHNFVDVILKREAYKKDYVLYFGSYSVEKGIDTLIQACEIPELIRPGEIGELFESGNGSDLKEKIWTLWNDADKLNEYVENCQNQGFDSIEQYCERLMKVYGVCHWKKEKISPCQPYICILQ